MTIMLWIALTFNKTVKIKNCLTQLSLNFYKCSTSWCILTILQLINVSFSNQQLATVCKMLLNEPLLPELINAINSWVLRVNNMIYRTEFHLHVWSMLPIAWVPVKTYQTKCVSSSFLVLRKCLIVYSKNK